MVSFILIKIGRDAVFFAERDLEHLPLAYLWISVAAIPAAMIHLKALDRWETIQLEAVCWWRPWQPF